MKTTFMMAAVSTLHRGHRLTASASPAHDGLHAADLLIEKPGRAPESFAALDYYFDDQQALKYATSCAKRRALHAQAPGICRMAFVTCPVLRRKAVLRPDLSSRRATSSKF